MMHQCSGSPGNMAGACSCGVYHAPANSFSMFFSVPNSSGDAPEMYSNYTASSPSSVDCTLSLGTPSTRRTESDDRRSAGAYVSNFCWDLLHSKHSSQKSGGRAGGNNSAGNNTAGDSLLPRRCANCDTTSTPLWRNGPRGPKSLCNACGIRFKKEERRAAATVSGVGAGNYTNSSSWFPHHSPAATQKIPYLSPAAINNEFKFMEEDNRTEQENGISFLSWRLNVTDRPSLVHDFTR